MSKNDCVMIESEKRLLLEEIKKVKQSINTKEGLIVINKDKFNENLYETIENINELIQSQFNHIDSQKNELETKSQIISNLLPIKSSLDSTSTNVMISDENFNIIYLNQNITNMFSIAEEDIKKVFPKFNSAKLLGINIDSFHKNPANQRKILKNLKNNELHKSQIVIGNRIFKLIANQARNEKDEIIGYGVEWSDVTQLLKNEKEKENILNESLRIKSALDNTSTNVMMADTDFNIIYMNNNILKMFKEAQDDIRKQFPRFDHQNLIGISIDSFHKDPASQRRILSGLTGSGVHNSVIKIGVRTFYLVANKAVNEKREILGYGVEWSDITEQQNAEQKIDNLVQALVQGELDKRVDPKGLSGFTSKIALGLNNMLDGIIEPVMDIKEIISKMGEGDLTIDTKDVYRGDFITIRNAFENSLKNLNDVLSQTKSTVDEISHMAVQIRTTSHSVAANAQQQSSSIEESSSSLMQTANMVKTNAENANIAKQLVIETADAASDGQNKMKEMTEAMDNISRSSEDIAKIIKVIDEIAFQTNLLALNAAVEAARAGKYGKGFAVVAQEVRNLAERSAQAAKETSELIDSSSKKVRQGVNFTQATAESLGQIVINVIKVKDLVSEIAVASDEQSKGINEVNKAMVQINQGTQSNSQQSIELASSSEQLGRQTELLRQAVKQFRLREKNDLFLNGFKLPDGLTMETINQVLKLFENQKKIPQSVNGELKSNEQEVGSISQLSQSDPRKVLPLDEDERGFQGF
jgi:methyl-accepting chemotaxis protein